MVFSDFHFYSEVLGIQTAAYILLPQPQVAAQSSSPIPVLYLLHGLSDDHTMWLRQTRVEQYAQRYRLAVVMPAANRSFYMDMAHGAKYETFVSRELPSVIECYFPVCRKRSGRFIAGLSMGGYGALRNGLKYHHTFGAIAALSSADIIQQIATFTDDNPAFFARRGYAQALFGPLEKLPGSDKDLRWLAQRITNPADRPRIYLACGSQDSLLPMNKNLRDSLQTLGYDLTWCEAPGAHEWDFWDSQIRRVIDWLSLGQADAGVNSGNVGV